MKRIGIMLLFTAFLWAQTANTYSAPTGSVNPQTIGSLYFDGGGSAIAAAGLSGCYFTNYDCGFATGKVSYALVDGSSATLPGFAGVMHALGNGIYRVEGSASGTDNSGHNVRANDVQFTFSVFCRSGRGGGCNRKYIDGSMTLTVN